MHPGQNDSRLFIYLSIYALITLKSKMKILKIYIYLTDLKNNFK